MNDALSERRRALPQDSAGMPAWILQRATEHGFELDPAQRQTLAEFERIPREMLAAADRLRQPFVRFFARKQPIKGIYLWGGVGRGKSFLMDAFFDGVPVARKTRIHFHRFMQEIHQRLSQHQGEIDPIPTIAEEIANDANLLCLDEFHITDITDAMLMRGLLESLFEREVVLVTTSNQHPDELYRDGLQRSQFLPAIELIKQQLEVINVDAGTDYRLRELERAGVYHIETDSVQQLEKMFEHISNQETAGAAALRVEGRLIHARKHADGIVWFDFEEICGGPRGKPDYIELARRYHTVIISEIPRFGPEQADMVRRFTWLIDEFYDRRVKLICSAVAPVHELYPQAAGGDQFERTASRMIEMQTRDYLQLAHLP